MSPLEHAVESALRALDAHPQAALAAVTRDLRRALAVHREAAAEAKTSMNITVVVDPHAVTALGAVSKAADAVAAAPTDQALVDQFAQAARVFANACGRHLRDQLRTAPADRTECSGDPASCPENEGFGCCQTNPQPKPDIASPEVNAACWAFVEAMPHRLPGPIWNDLKPAVHAAICKYLDAAPQPQPVGEVTVTRREDGSIAAVTRTDDDGRVLSVISECQRKPAEPVAWIPVTERMPEPDSGEVLVWLSGGMYALEEWHTYREDPTGMGTTHTLDMGVMWRHFDFEEVTHWMPLPPAPGAAPQPQRVPLTDEQVMQAARHSGLYLEPTRNRLIEVRGQHAQLVNMARAIERAHGITGEPQPQRVPLTLPPLPEPYTRQWIAAPHTERLLFTDEQMTAYARACAAAWGIALADTEGGDK